MIGANGYIKELMKGTQANAYGFYSLTLSGGNFTLVTSYVGFLEQEIPVTLDKDLHININLKSKTYQAQEVVIEAERKDRNVESIDMARNTLEVDKIKTLPALMGQEEFLETAQVYLDAQTHG